GETSVENSFSVNETDLQQQQPVGDYSSTTPVINNGSGGISSQDNMVSGVTNIPATSIGTENNIQEPNPNS
ncbi:MAG TPA: hypothetical protein PLS50_02430, partial [Candidatus Dojkabacteria bacterium]|nr:hypothetical protein [Candidatus Dojkabacteria bacterium]